MYAASYPLSSGEATSELKPSSAIITVTRLLSPLAPSLICLGRPPWWGACFRPALQNHDVRADAACHALAAVALVHVTCVSRGLYGLSLFYPIPSLFRQHPRGYCL
jgi:hypothetical protein